jgi:hypothetical protein
MIADVSVIGVFCCGDAAHVALLCSQALPARRFWQQIFLGEKRSVPIPDVLSSHVSHEAV